uniref:Uncharacterized protein n=1 Tax=Aegilops tauschii subsp. strangulata TaxID=200361 RepID=A0A453JLV7_AEGTS
ATAVARLELEPVGRRLALPCSDFVHTRVANLMLEIGSKKNLILLLEMCTYSNFYLITVFISFCFLLPFGAQ